jgi:hypothetical protein
MIFNAIQGGVDLLEMQAGSDLSTTSAVTIALSTHATHIAKQNFRSHHNIFLDMARVRMRQLELLYHNKAATS